MYPVFKQKERNTPPNWAARFTKIKCFLRGAREAGADAEEAELTQSRSMLGSLASVFSGAAWPFSGLLVRVSGPSSPFTGPFCSDGVSSFGGSTLGLGLVTM